MDHPHHCQGCQVLHVWCDGFTLSCTSKKPYGKSVSENCCMCVNVRACVRRLKNFAPGG